MTCTCGAKSVLSHLHSSWCDSMRPRDIYDDILECGRLGEDTVYIATEYRDPEWTYNHFKELSKEEWFWTTEASGVYTVKLKTMCEASFIGEGGINSLANLLATTVFLEDCPHANELMDKIYSINPKVIRIKLVNPFTKEPC